MPNTDRNEMPMLPPEQRVQSFAEAALGFDEATALAEASRCLGCRKPRCVEGCPLGNHIPDFIAKIKERDYKGALEVIRLQSDFSAVCSRVCPQEEQCENKCILGVRGKAVAIGSLERFVNDYVRQCGLEQPSMLREPQGMKAAVIGSGPAGLSVANELNKLGYQVTVFEAEDKPGGILYYGIPEFRLPKKAIIRPLVKAMEQRGIRFVTGVVVGVDYTIDMLMDEKGYQAVFVATGAGETRRMNIAGETSGGVYGADEFLAACNMAAIKRQSGEAAEMPHIGKRLAVVGGGNVAMDVARTARRLKAEHVYIIYRRSEAELPARNDEVLYAKQEGVEFMLQCNPLEIITDSSEQVLALKCVRTELGEPDESGRRSSHEIAGSEFRLEVDSVVMAIGQKARTRIKDTTEGLDTGRRGYIIVDEATLKTTRDGVFAGGDVVTGAATVAKAVQAGKKAALAMHEYMQSLKATASETQLKK